MNDNMERPRAQSLDALFSIAEEGTIDDLCHELEGSLDRPVMNETHLEGRYRGQVQTVTAGNAFSNPGLVIAGDVLVMIVFAAAVIAAAL